MSTSSFSGLSPIQDTEAVETISVSVLDVVEAITLTNSSFEQLENQIEEFQLDASAADGSLIDL